MLPFVAIQSNDRLECLWRNVPAWSEVGDDWTMDRKQFCDLLFIRPSCKSSADRYTSSSAGWK